MSEQKTTQKKARRKLSNIDFQNDGAHIALVGDAVGGPANEEKLALVLKANKFSKEFIEKAQRIKVEMELPEFLQRFYGMWYEEEAKDLAKLFGWVDYEEVLDGVENALEGERTVEVVEVNPMDYVRTKLQDADQMLELAQQQNLASALANLTEEQYLALLQDQEQVEKALKKVNKASNESVTPANAEVANAPQNAGVGNTVEATTSVIKKKETEDMPKTVDTGTPTQVKMVAASELALVQKALDDQKVALEKALETVAKYEKEKKEAVEKQRFEDVKAAVKLEDHAEAIFKAVKDADEEVFVAVVKALASITAAVDDSQLFSEQGATTEDTTIVKQNPVERMLKAKFAAK